MRKRDLRAAKSGFPATSDQAQNYPAEAPQSSQAHSSGPDEKRPTSDVRPESLLPPPTRIPVPGRQSENADAAKIDLAPTIALESRPPLSTENLLEELVKRKARNRLWMSLALVAFAAGSIATMFLLLNSPAKRSASSNSDVELPVEGQAKKLAAEKTVAPEQATPAVERQAQADPSAELKQAEQPVLAETESSADKPLTWGELKYFGRRDLEKLWAQLHPYIFRLVVKKAGAELTISGLLLDSRGYLVTSLSAIEGATSIVVTPAPSDPLAELPSDALKDEIRGVLAVDRAHDLALLQINRRLVTVVNGLQPSEKLLVPRRSIVQAAALGPERLGWLTESKIQESSSGKFPEALQRMIERSELDLGPFWPQHELQLATGAGAGLFTDDGRLGGVNTGFKHEGGQLIAEAEAVFELLRQAKGAAEPLSSLTKSPQPAAEGPVASANDSDNPTAAPANSSLGTSPFPAGHEAEPLAKRLADSALACESFGWLTAQEGAQPAELPAALTAWREARELVRARRLFPEDSKLLSKQVGYWTGRINATLLSLDREQSAELNRKAWASLEGETAQTLVLFVRVVLQPGTSPRLAGADTATFQLLGTEEYLIAEVEPNAAPLLPDSEWLVVVTVDPNEEILVNPQPDKQAKARKATGCKEISEIKSIGFRVEPLKSNFGKQSGDQDQ